MKKALPLLTCVLLLAACGKGPSGKEPARIKVVARKYTFEPQVIRLKKGEPVILEVSTTDVQHGFFVPGLGISEPIPKGKPAEIRFIPEARGEYRVECDIICGAGHDEMAGKIIVE